MISRERQGWVFVTATALAGWGLLGGIAALDYYLHPDYARIKMGMSKAEVENLFVSGKEEYPHNSDNPDKGGLTSHYFTTEGRVEVDYDVGRRVVHKSLKH